MRIADRHIDDAGRERQASAISARRGDRKMFGPEMVPTVRRMTTRHIICVLALLCGGFLAIPARAQQHPEPEDPEDEKKIGLWLDQGISTPFLGNKSLDVEFHERLDEGASNLYEYFVQGGIAFRLRPWFTLRIAKANYFVATKHTFWSAWKLALLACACQSCLCAIRYSDTLLLRYPRGDRQHKFPGWTRGPKMLLSVGLECHAVTCQPSDMLKRFRARLRV
jgi:hypothetical protein